MRRWGLEQRARSAAGSLTLPVSPLSLRYQARRDVYTPRKRFREAMTRALNVVVALVGLTVSAPIMFVVAMLVKLTSPGPVVYKQLRVGLDRRSERGPHTVNRRRSEDLGGRIFTIYKFRTMSPDKGSQRQVWAAKNDPRITPIGGFLRATRLDEVPQFFNVLKGDMNIVGPRPEQPGIFQELRQELGHYRKRQRVLPGITGLAQVELGYDTDLEGVKKKVDLDLEYIRRRSAGQDLKIMAKTVPVMVFRKVWM